MFQQTAAMRCSELIMSDSELHRTRDLPLGFALCALLTLCTCAVCTERQRRMVGDALTPYHFMQLSRSTQKTQSCGPCCGDVNPDRLCRHVSVLDE